jgi:hypothetical protein
MTGDRHRYRHGVALAAVVALVASGCTRPWWAPKPTTTTSTAGGKTTTTRTAGGKTTTTMGGMDHSVPDRLNHAPTEEQKAAALKWVDETRAAVKEDGWTVAKLVANHYISIGDGIHYVKPEYTRDDFELDPHHIEAFAVFNGKPAAAMYIYNPKRLDTTMADVPDIAGNWTIWHGHDLPYKSDDPNNDDSFRLGADKNGVVHMRHDPPMIHVWFQPNKCGPWASAGVGEGSCIKELANY